MGCLVKGDQEPHGGHPEARRRTAGLKRNPIQGIILTSNEWLSLSALACYRPTSLVTLSKDPLLTLKPQPEPRNCCFLKSAKDVPSCPGLQSISSPVIEKFINMLSLNPTFSNNHSMDNKTSHGSESPRRAAGSPERAFLQQDIVSVQSSCSMLAHNQNSEKGSMKQIPNQYIPSLMNSNQCNINTGAGA